MPSKKPLTYGSTISLFSPTFGKYVVAEDHGGSNCNRTAVGPWEKFIIYKTRSLKDSVGKEVEYGHQVVLFSDVHQKYLVAEDHHDMNANRSEAGPWEAFTIIDPCNIKNCDGPVNVKKSVSFLSHHGKYMVGEDKGSLRCDRNEVGPWEKFKIIVHDRYPLRKKKADYKKVEKEYDDEEEEEEEDDDDDISSVSSDEYEEDYEDEYEEEDYEEGELIETDIFDENSITILRSIFDQLDKDGEGLLDRKELKKFHKKIGESTKKSEMKHELKEYGEEGTLTFEEFVDFISEAFFYFDDVEQADIEETLEFWGEIFEVFD